MCVCVCVCSCACVYVHVCVHARGLGIVLDSQASYSRDGKACNSVSGCGLV